MGCSTRDWARHAPQFISTRSQVFLVGRRQCLAQAVNYKDSRTPSSLPLEAQKGESHSSVPPAAQGLWRGRAEAAPVARPHILAAIPALSLWRFLAPKALSRLRFHFHPDDLVATSLSHFTEAEAEPQREGELWSLGTRTPYSQHCSAPVAAAGSPSPHFDRRGD